MTNVQFFALADFRDFRLRAAMRLYGVAKSRETLEEKTWRLRALKSLQEQAYQDFTSAVLG